MRTRMLLSIAVALLWLAPDARAFCGFYVGRADADLFNEASQVVLARHGDRTVISMMNDFEGDLTDFALVVPVPVVLEKGQIHVGDAALFRRIDAFTAPRLVEYHDDDPCRRYRIMALEESSDAAAPAARKARSDDALGVTVEASYTVGEYDIVILSAKESNGLETWLRRNDYRIPEGAHRALQPYIRQDMNFFVAKVNLEEQARTGLTNLRPLQFAFEDPRFMLPIRLGMINARGPQDLIVYVLTKEGRVETTNYPTVKIPTGMDLPLFIKDEFAGFYRDLFAKQVERERMRSVFTEYFWDMGWCDPCAANPLTHDELRKLGVFWIRPEAAPRPEPGRAIAPPSRGLPVKVTRLHVRYSDETFPEDLVFQETGDRQNFQARYVLRHPWLGGADKCDAAKQYYGDLRKRQEKAAQTLADLTGRDLAEIRKRIDFVEPDPPERERWWEWLWG